MGSGLAMALRTLLAGGVLAWAIVLGLLSGAAQAQEPLPVPALTARVIDQTGTLSATQRQALEDKLSAFEAQAGPQIVVLMVPTTQPEDIAAYTQRVGESWKIGRRDVGDGLLLVVAKNDRRLWIAPAKALEGAVPDLAARQIVRDVISPAFKQGDWYGGLDRGLERLFERIRGEGLKPPTPAASGEDGFQLDDLLMFFFVAVPVVGAVLSGLFGRRLGSVLTATGTGASAGWLSHSLWLGVAAGAVALVLVGLVGVSSTLQRAAQRGRGGRAGRGPVIFGDGGWAGGGGSGGFGGLGGGGGGFSSGGGGDFGGGGAGGDW